MFLKKPRPNTDQRVRSLLQKAARRGYEDIVELVTENLDRRGDRSWLRSRSVVITFEECWPLAALLSIGTDLNSKRTALLRVANSAKQKDAAGLGALAYAYHEGDQSMLDCVPDPHHLRIVAAALDRPSAFFEWALALARSESASAAVHSAKKYLAVATWQWDKACILGGAFLATKEWPEQSPAPKPVEAFPYWVALDKHTPEGKTVLAQVAKNLRTPSRQITWASFYFESAKVNRLLSSNWWKAEATWRLRRAGLTLETAADLWERARPLVRDYLSSEADALKRFVETPDTSQLFHSAETKMAAIQESTEAQMEDRAKQTEAFLRTLDLTQIPAAERPKIMRGVNHFFDRGWPSNFVTVGMAARAGDGLMPPKFQGPDSEAEYKARMAENKS